LSRSYELIEEAEEE